ncbi:MAG: hypothetical protein IJP84_10830 [Lachnospiraceae bacterium]|nr:hypothetical protein [Lachnospiraceae bacterium]
MFDRFYRSDEARSYEGTGLGLSIAKWIVDKHSAYFEIVSREDLSSFDLHGHLVFLIQVLILKFYSVLLSRVYG